MSKLTNTMIASAVALTFAAAPAAFAGEAQMTAQPQDAQMTVQPQTETRVEAPESMTMTLRNEVDEEVRGAIASGQYEAVEGPDGQIYYNRYVAYEELPDPTLELGAVETYEFEYNGVTYTNKIVNE